MRRLHTDGALCCQIASTPRELPAKDEAFAAFTRCRKDMPEFPAITHVALTVTSLERSVPWYKALFGSDPILDEDTGPFPRVAWLTRGTLCGVTQFPVLSSTEPFNERRPGLDHLAFGCASRDELRAWEIHLVSRFRDSLTIKGEAVEDLVGGFVPEVGAGVVVPGSD